VGVEKPRIVGIGGTTRPESTSEKLLVSVLARCEALGAETMLFGGAKLIALPHYDPENKTRTREQDELVAAVRAADAVVIATPGYHGGASALVKNAIDLLEDTRGDARCYLDGCPVGIIVSAAGWQATGVTLSSMRDIVCSLRGWPTPVGVVVNSLGQRPFDEEGRLIDSAIETAVSAQASQIMSRLL
jgi:FMN reductase